MRNIEDISMQFVKGVGPAKKKLFARLGIETVADLFYLFPRRYEDRSQMTPLSDVVIGQMHTVSGTIVTGGSRRSWYAKKHVIEITLDDKKARIFCVWFNQPYLQHYLKVGTRIVAYGKVEQYKNRLQMVAPEYEIIDEADESLHMGRIVPIYPLTKGMTQRYVRKVIRAGFESYEAYLMDVLPVAIRNKHHLYNIKHSLSQIHFPDDFKNQEEAMKRVSFEEFFLFQLSVSLRRRSIISKEGIPHEISDELIQKYCESFEFNLTGAQRRVIGEVSTDLRRTRPMLRLLQGDVGSGKTVAALFGCVAAEANGSQAAIMAPTEILAQQHYQTVDRMLAGTPFGHLKTALLTSSVKKSDRQKILEELEKGEIGLLIGTHSLLSEEVAFKKLSYVVIDEQHKFGVRQRALLSSKGRNPDVLIMTATPIPRTLCITLYGDLDVSVIDEMPAGRGQVVTKVINQENAADAYALVAQMVSTGRQAYIIYPIIEESEKLDLKAAQERYRHFENHEFKDYSVGLVHGQMKKAEAQTVMQRFKDKEIDILVSTTVIEVGVDVENANVMLIEHAERFGLSQLHQLRGRIGRGAQDAICVLLSDPITEDARLRLKAIAATTDGFKISQDDLAIRGPGQFFGRHQHGLNELRFANPANQVDILELARTEATEIIESDPELLEEQNRRLRQTVEKRYPAYLKNVEAG